MGYGKGNEMRKGKGNAIRWGEERNYKDGIKIGVQRTKEYSTNELKQLIGLTSPRGCLPCRT